MTLGIEITGLSVRYGDHVALDDVNLSWPGGKIYGLLGRNGAGKTTLLSVLSAYSRATTGTVRLNGKDPYQDREVASQICFVRHSVDVYRSARVRSVLQLNQRLRPTWDPHYAQQLVKQFDIPLDRKVGALSLGGRSALGIVIGLAAKAPLTIFDESYLGLDVPGRQAFYDELLEEYAREQRTIILSTHLIEELGGLLEEVVILDGGRVVVQEEADVLREWGTSVTGPAGLVDEFTKGLRVIGERELGPTKSATVYGELSGEWTADARAHGLELGPVGLQDLFVHLTSDNGRRAR